MARRIRYKIDKKTINELGISKKSMNVVLRQMRLSKPEDDKVHIIAKNHRWAVKREGTSRASLIVRNKVTAMAKAASLTIAGTPLRIVVHRKDGTVEASR
jgi:hypothetical protein